MINNARYAHTNIVAHDYQSLASFYKTVFGCVFVPPERNFSGAALEAGTGLPDAAVKGLHLRLPGHGGTGPTLEIYTYSHLADGPAPAVNRPGLAHLAFDVPNVEDARKQAVAAGGQAVGEIVSLTISESEQVTWCYVTDPEGNIIGLESRG